MRVLRQLGPHRFEDETIVLAFPLRPVRNAPAFEGHPVNPHLPHVVFGERPGILGLEVQRPCPEENYEESPVVVRFGRLRCDLGGAGSVEIDRFGTNKNVAEGRGGCRPAFIPFFTRLFVV